MVSTEMEVGNVFVGKRRGLVERFVIHSRRKFVTKFCRSSIINENTRLFRVKLTGGKIRAIVFHKCSAISLACIM